MKRYRKYIYILTIALIAFFTPKITYSIDSNLVIQDKRPIFVIRTQIYKDGGTKVYRGIGYQVIKWNRMSITGTEFGYEIFKFPNFRNVNEGPVKKLRIISNE